MIALASGLRVHLACGVTDMRKGMTGLADAAQWMRSARQSARHAGRALDLADLLAEIDDRARTPEQAVGTETDSRSRRCCRPLPPLTRLACWWLARE